MIISAPQISQKEGQAFLTSIIIDEVTNKEKEYFFSVSEQYKDYLCNEVADAFLVAMLLPALFSGQDIKIEAPISQLLKYQIDNSVLFTLSHVFEKRPIRVLPVSTIDPGYHPEAVVTGFSGGVDSFMSVLQHTSEDCPDSLRLTHLTLFNVGNYGNDELNTQKSFHADAQRAKQFSKVSGLPLVLLNSNVSKAYDVDEMIYGFTPRSIISIISGILSLQKLFSVYIVASSETIDALRLDKWYQASYETLIASFLSTTRTRIVIGNPDLTKVEKIKRIADNPIVQKNLYVCLADIINEIGNIKIEKSKISNCAECYKCLDTLVILDMLGYLDKYTSQFEIEKYHLKKAAYFKHILRQRKTKSKYREIYSLINEMNYMLPDGVAGLYKRMRFADALEAFVKRLSNYIQIKILHPIITYLKSLGKQKYSYS